MSLAMDPTCDGKSLGGFQLGVMKSGFFLKKKSHILLCGTWIVVKRRMQGYQAAGQEMLESGQGRGTETMRSGEVRSMFSSAHWL